MSYQIPSTITPAGRDLVHQHTTGNARVLSTIKLDDLAKDLKKYPPRAQRAMLYRVCETFGFTKKEARRRLGLVN